MLTAISLRRALPLELNAFALMARTLLTAALGLVFWALAARWFSPHDVGRASAELSTALLLSTMCQLNFGNVFPRFVPVAGARTGAFVLRGYALTLGLSLLVGCIVVSTPYGRELLVDAPGSAAVFVLAICLLTVFTLVDAVLTGLRRTGWLLGQNAVIAVAKLVALAPLAWLAPRQGIVWAWIAPIVLAVVGVNWWLFRHAIPARQAEAVGESWLPPRRALLAFTGAEYANGLVGNLVPLVLPLMVLHELGAVTSAYFYIPWITNAALNMLVANVALSLVVESVSLDPGDQRNTYLLFCRAVRLAAAVALLSAGAVLLFAPFVLGLVGPGYADAGVEVSRLLALAVPLNVVGVLFASLCRIDGTVGRLVVSQVGTAAAILAAAWLLVPRLGLNGVGVAYLAVQGVTALLLLAPVISRARRLRARHPAPATAVQPG
jgi:O-antigen/teichoic acid export membrane protein